MLVSAESEYPNYLTVKLFSKNSNLCDHDTFTPWTDIDGRTDGRLAVAIPHSA